MQASSTFTTPFIPKASAVISILLACSLAAPGYGTGQSSQASPKPAAAGSKTELKSKTKKEAHPKRKKDKATNKAADGKSSGTHHPKVTEKEEPSGKPVQQPQAETIGHPFSWPFIGWEDMKPRGGTSKGSQTELDTEANPAFYRIQERGISRKERDRRAILALAGDYRVSFDFIETSSSTFPYKPPRPYFSWATERVFIIEEKPDFISIQHILVMEFVDENGETQGPFTMKHWRQDWTYQDTSLFEFLGDRTWKSKSQEKIPGQWSQAVYQVDDSPRYETTGNWDHRGGVSVFRSRSFWRPLPRREFSVRDDYNVLGGRHEINVTPGGWLHTQINRKIVGENGKIDKVLAEELGAVRYERIKSPSLDSAEDYWKATAPLWSAVRRKWRNVLSGGEPIQLHKNVDDKPMYSHLFALAGKMEDDDLKEKDRKATVRQATRIIDRFIKSSDEQR